MELLQKYTIIAVQTFHVQAQLIQQKFISLTQNVDFFSFCFIYAIILIVILKKLSKPEKFRPVNRQLISWRKYYKEAFTQRIMSLPFISSYTKGKIDKQFQKLDEKLVEDLDKQRDPRKSFKLPSTGMTQENLKKRINEWSSKQLEHMNTGKISGALYLFDESYYQDLSTFAAKYMYHNPLHLDTFKQLMRMQSEVVKMTASLISQDPQNNAHGIITSGGSESLIMALYAYKCYYSGRTRPNIVVPNTVHAAVDKGCFYFNIQVRKAKIDSKTYQVDLKHLESMIDGNTILIIGSYPNYPHGIVDPILAMAKLGLKYNIGVHIDGCLGGFVAAFDKEHQKIFNIDTKGITSVSLDQHKFGLAPKGVSTIFFKTKELRMSMYYLHTEWVGGLYGTPSFNGSRHGFASAGAWYAMTRNTQIVYKQNTRQMIDATLQASRKLRQIPGIIVFGNPQLCALAFDSETISCFDLCSYLNKTKGYDISPIHLPKGIHISLTLANKQKIRNELPKDVAQGLQHLKLNKPHQSNTAAIYGASSTLPTSNIGDDFLKVVMGATFK